MRKIIIAAWLAASSLLIAVPAAADGPVSLPPLAPGEVLLETNAVGITRSAASSARITASVMVEASSEAEARRAAAGAVQRITAAARAAGVPASDIEAGAVDVNSNDYAMSNTVDIDGNMAMEVAEEPVHYGGTTVVIRLRNAAAAPALQRALGEIENVSSGSPEYVLDDDSAARRAARAEAVRRARADAEAYAAALNMRIARVLRVTERTGLDFIGMALSESNTAMRTFRDYERTMAEGQVMTFVIVGVDYALAPQ